MIHSPAGGAGGRNEDPHGGGPTGPGADAVVQEPWDHERFMETYDRVAKARGGWRFEANGRTPEELRRRYLAHPEDAPTIESFAEGLFTWDQGLNL